MKSGPNGKTRPWHLGYLDKVVIYQWLIQKVSATQVVVPDACGDPAAAGAAENSVSWARVRRR